MARLDPHWRFQPELYILSGTISLLKKFFPQFLFDALWREHLYFGGGLNSINTCSTSCSMMMSDQSSSVNDVAMRRCSKCRNHGVLVRLKGHKPFCRFRDCSCMACCRLEEKKVVTRIRKMQLATANGKSPSLPSLSLSLSLSFSL